MLTVALSKGYLLDEAMQLFGKVGIQVAHKKEELSRKLEFYDVTGNYRFLVIRPTDVPVYVECGAADIGVSGRDVILEGEYKVAQLLDLKFGYCRLATAGIKGQFTPESYFSGMRVATKFVNSATQFFKQRGIDIELIKLYGSVELAPLDGLSDIIVDLVATGRTLKEHGLEVIEPIYETTARLIANSVKVKTKYAEIMDITKRIQKFL